MSRQAIIGVVALLAAACVLPFVVSEYRTFQFTLVLVYAIALLGLNILTGYNGQISLGHGAFYAIGAYAAAILMDRYGVPYWATLPAAAAVCLAARSFVRNYAASDRTLVLSLSENGCLLRSPETLLPRRAEQTRRFRPLPYPRNRLDRSSN